MSACQTGRWITPLTVTVTSPTRSRGLFGPVPVPSRARPRLGITGNLDPLQVQVPSRRPLRRGGSSCRGDPRHRPDGGLRGLDCRQGLPECHGIVPGWHEPELASQRRRHGGSRRLASERGTPGRPGDRAADADLQVITAKVVTSQRGTQQRSCSGLCPGAGRFELRYQHTWTVTSLTRRTLLVSQTPSRGP